MRLFRDTKALKSVSENKYKSKDQIYNSNVGKLV